MYIINKYFLFMFYNIWFFKMVKLVELFMLNFFFRDGRLSRCI